MQMAKINYDAVCSCVCAEEESWGFITSGSSGGLDKAVISKVSNSPPAKDKEKCDIHVVLE